MALKDFSDCTSFTGWSQVTESGFPDISGGFIRSTHAATPSFNTVGVYRTTPTVIASGDIFYWKQRATAVGLDSAELHLMKNGTGIAYDSGGTIRAGILWTFTFPGGNVYIDVWDTTQTLTGVDTGLTLNANTDYEFKGTVNSDGTVTYKYRATGAGSWTSIGTTTLARTASLIGESIYFSEQAYGTGIDYFLKEFDLSPTPAVNAGTDDSCLLVDGVALNGVVELGVPTATTTWTKFSGPGTVTFDDDTDPTTNANFSVAGTYVLRLTLTDGDYTVTDDVTITVTSNSPPIVDAGDDQIIDAPEDTATLDGSVSDDGNPDPPGTLDILWTKVSGPGTVTFVDDTDPTTDATFSVTGTYVLRLTADDSEESVFDEVTIQINSAPVVDAGEDQNIFYPESSTTLEGSFTEDGLAPDAEAQWTQVSGPGTATFDDDTDPTTDVSFDINGPYTLRLTVVDGSFTITDDVNISIKWSKSLDELMLAKFRAYAGVPDDLSYDMTLRKYFIERSEIADDPQIPVSFYMHALFDSLNLEEGTLDYRFRKLFIEESAATEDMPWADAARLWAETT